jgi:hypothetical protein
MLSAYADGPYIGEISEMWGGMGYHRTRNALRRGGAPPRRRGCRDEEPSAEVFARHRATAEHEIHAGLLLPLLPRIPIKAASPEAIKAASKAGVSASDIAASAGLSHSWTLRKGKKVGATFKGRPRRVSPVPMEQLAKEYWDEGDSISTIVGRHEGLYFKLVRTSLVQYAAEHGLALRPSTKAHKNLSCATTPGPSREPASRTKPKGGETTMIHVHDPEQEQGSTDATAEEHAARWETSAQRGSDALNR